MWPCRRRTVWRWKRYTPVLLDDIVSSGHTMAQATALLRQAGAAAPVCIVVHALFAGDAEAVVRQAGPACIVSCNTLPHGSNQIDIMPLLAAEAARLCRGASAAVFQP